MSQSPDRPSIAPLLATLDVARNARRGFGAALAITAFVFVVFVLLPDTDVSPLYFLALGFVLVTSLGGLLTAILVTVRVVRLARE